MHSDYEADRRKTLEKFLKNKRTKRGGDFQELI